MSKLVLMFPGQGSQYEGMGLSFLRKHTDYGKYFDLCSRVVGEDIVDLITKQPQKLNETNYSQPSIYALSCALFDYLKQNTTLAESAGTTIGHSLGDYSALYASGAYSYKQGLEAVDYRSRLMARQNELSGGIMAAVLGMDYRKVEEEIAKLGADIYIANYNDYTQTVISGKKEEVNRAIGQLKDRGIRKILPLKVGVASHCPLMAGVADKLKEYLSHNMGDTALNIPFFSTTILEFVSPEKINEVLQKQLLEPVKWLFAVLKLIEKGYETFIEIGPKNVLSRLTERIAAEKGSKITVYNTEQDWDRLLIEFKGE